MGELGTTPRTGGASDRRERPDPRPRRTRGSLLWAVGLTAAMVVGAGIAQWVTWLGAVLSLASVAVTACLVGGVWHRAGAAAVASVTGSGLVLFAGPALYEVYMRSAGEPVPAVVTSVAERPGAGRCALRELDGGHRAYEVAQQGNCFGRARAGDRVEIRVDPLGLLEPRLPDATDQPSTTDATAAVAACLALTTAAAVLHGGRRRRADGGRAEGRGQGVTGA
ncbi:hypothetical protein ABTX35_05075 [Streptomyces sp. NPDC096080]|uniref:hypothetical protein n=1 Tax=Streptomyces sp. NPDC096080 TaxID=3156693 RepID=UPI00332DC791